MTRLLDAHVHFWDPSARRHDWLGEVPCLCRRFGPEDLDTGTHDMGVVFIQADCRDDEALDEVHWVRRLADAGAPIRGIVAHAAVDRGRQVEDHLDALALEPLVVGVRQLLQGRPREQLIAPELIAGVRLLPRWRLTFDVCATHDQLPEVATLVHSCPATTFVLDHLGKPPVASAELDPWRANINRLAALPNLVCKLSGLTTEAAPGWTADDVRPYLEYALGTFGPRRCMFGSDWPVSTLRGAYQDWVDVVLDLIAGLPAEDRAAVLAGTGEHTYGVSPPALAGEAEWRPS